MIRSKVNRRLPHLCGLSLVGGMVFVLTLWFSAEPGAAQPEPTSQPVRRFTSRPPGESADEEAGSSRLRKLTHEEILKLRFLELRGARQGATARPEPITVRLDNKLVDEFLTSMEGDNAFLSLMGGQDNPNYTMESAKADFRKLTSAQKVHLMAAEKGAAFAEKIQISSDTEVFVEFRKRVMPAILQGCATSGCHAIGSGEEVKFELFKDPKKTPETTYANFIVLNDLQVDGMPLLNRSNPANSLLLSYMLPPKDVKADMRHPGKAEFRPIFQSKTGMGYRRIESWIQSLNDPADEYGIHLITSKPKSFSEEPAQPPP